MIPIIYCGACKKPREAVIFFKILGDPYAWCKDCYDHWLHHTDPETYARRVMRVQCMTKEEYLVAEVMYQ